MTNLRQDAAAARVVLSDAWSAGQVEGQVIETKLVKRQGNGRLHV